MARTQSRPKSGEKNTGPRRSHVNYNLEKEPLRGDGKHLAAGWRTGLDLWTRRRRAAGWLAFVLMLLMVGIGATVIRLLVRAVGNRFGLE